MTSLKCRYLFVDWLLGRLVLLEISGPRSLPIAINKCVEINHTLIEALQFAHEQEGEEEEEEEEYCDDGEE